MFRKWFTRFVGAAFMVFSIYLAVVAIGNFTENRDWGSLLVNLLGALVFLLVGAGVSGLLRFILKKAGVSMTALAVNFKAIVGGTLVAVVLLSGIAMVVFGVRDAVRFTMQTRDYVSVQGHYAGKEIFRTDEDGTTYRLAYTYIVEDAQYTVLTNSGTQIIPKLGTEKEIRYDPQNPEKAVVAGDGIHVGLLFIGSMFTAGALLMILAVLHIKGKLRLRRINIMDIVMAVLFGGFGMGMLYITGGSFSVIAAFSHLGAFALFPAVFLIVAVFLVVRGLFFYKEK